MRTSILGVLIFVVAVAVANASAGQSTPSPQVPARDNTPSSVAGTAIVRGRVVDAQTGRPLRRVSVTVTGGGLAREGLSTSTDDDGRYEVTEVPAGRLTIEAERSGYLQLRYGQRRPREQGRPLDVASGQLVEKIDFALPRMSVISGHIVDELGEPIAGVAMSARRWMFFNGSRQLVPDARVTITDADGEYRLTGLVPGVYYVYAKTLDKWTVQANGREQTMSYAPTLFPGVTDFAQGSKVEVATGQQVEGIDFALVPGRAAKLSGIALDSKGQPLRTLVVASEQLGPNGGLVGGAGGATIGPDGTFEVLSVPPGIYKLQAVSSEESLTVPIVVNGDDISNLVLGGTAGWSVRGSVVIDSSAPAALRRNQVTIRAVPTAGVNGLSVAGGPSTRAVLNDDWTFSVTGVPGPARLRVTLPEGWVVKAILQNGRDIADQAIDLGSGEEISGLQVVLTDRSATLSGQVVDPKSSSSADGTVVLFSTDNSKWFENSRYVRVGRADVQGRFAIAGVLSGEYLAVALEYVEQGSWSDPEYLESIRKHGTMVTFSDVTAQRLTLPVVMTP